MPNLEDLIQSGVISGLTKHGEEQAQRRGFDNESIAKIITEGQQHKVEFVRYGKEQSQYRYTLNRNTVVVNMYKNENYLKIITVYSDDTFNDGKFIPFKEIE